MTILLITNHPAPYRQPLFDELARVVPGLLVLYEGSESAVRRWGPGTSQGYEQAFMSDAPIERISAVHKGRATARWLRRVDPSIVIAAGFGPSAIAALEWGLERRRPLLGWSGATELSERQVRKPLRAARKLIARRARGWIAYGPEAGRYLTGLGADPDRLVAAGNPCAIPARRPTGPSASSLRVGFVGQLHWRKAWWAPVQAAALAAREGIDVELRLVADGPGAALLERLVASVPDVPIRWERYVPPDDIERAYADLDLLVVPSLVDQWPIVASEAVAMGVPVACTPGRNSGLPEFVSTATGGTAIGPGAILDIVAAIRDLAAGSGRERVVAGIGAAQRELAPTAVARRWADLISTAA